MKPLSLDAMIAQEITTAVDKRVRLLASAVAKRFGDHSLALLFYGSCLRQQKLAGLMLDFYVIVDDYHRAYAGCSQWLAYANAWLPPNVFYHEQSIDGDVYRLKYAVISMDYFAKACSIKARSPSIWARFAQSCRLVWVQNEAITQRVVQALVQAHRTFFYHGLPLVSGPIVIRDVWCQTFALTYGAELRAEQATKGIEIFDQDPLRYQRIGCAIIKSLKMDSNAQGDQEMAAIEIGCIETSRIERGSVLAGQEPLALWSKKKAEKRWQRLQRQGKWLSVLRLIKGVFTFDGGIDYLAWKINRHSQSTIEIKAWQRRHPLIAGMILAIKLKRIGAIR